MNAYIPYGKQQISESDIKGVIETLKSPFLTQGPAVPNFEGLIAAEVECENVVVVNSATSALHIACLALGLGKGDWLWTSPTTFVASANCGLYCGASVDFVDIEPNTGLMDPTRLEAKLESAEKEGTLPKVVIPVHLAGSSCDMSSIKRLSKRYGFFIIEDASHAIGGRYRGRPVGCCQYSDITVFSFHPVKIITTGEGGAACTNSAYLAEQMKLLRTHGITKDNHKFTKERTNSPWAYEQQLLGYNYRMTDIQAALGASQILMLKEKVAERNRLYRRYKELLKGPVLDILEIPVEVQSSVHLAVARLHEVNAETHSRVFKGLRAAGIGVQLHYSPVYLQPYYERLGFKEGYCPEAEKYARTAVSMPLYPGLKEEEQVHAAHMMTQILGRAGD